MRKLIVAAIGLMFLVNIGLYVTKLRPVDNKPSRLPPIVAPVDPFSPVPSTPNQPPQPQKPPERIPTFVQVPVFRKATENSVYGDVLSHSKDAPFGDRGGRATNVHETAHGIHSYLRNKYTKLENGKLNRFNGFYCLDGRGVVLEEPNMRKSDINKFVPKNLRSYRYNLYLQGQQAWDDMPLYIYDEWVAYVLGGKCNVEDVQKGRYKGGWTDGVSGCLGFSIYAVATCMAVQEKDPEYWENNKQFRDFTIWMLRESQRTYMLGHKMDQFKWDKQDRLLNEFLTSKEGEPMRRFLREHLEGVWLDTDVRALRAMHYDYYQQLECEPGCRCRKVTSKIHQ